MPGYSGTPLAKKLGIKDDFRAALLHVPDEVKTELLDAFGKCRIEHSRMQASRDLDFIFLFAKSRAALEEGAGARRHAVGLVAEESIRRRH